MTCPNCAAAEARATAAEGERDALRAQLAERATGIDRLTAHMARVPSLEAERDTARADYFSLADAVCRESTGVADACRQARETRAALAEARGREKALREALAGLLAEHDDVVCPCPPSAAARAALALPYSPQGTTGAAAQQLSAKEK